MTASDAGSTSCSRRLPRCDCSGRSLDKRRKKGNRMKIAVTATGATLESPVDPRFGRCPCFLIVETDNLNFEAVANPNASRDSGAGIQAAQLLASIGVRFVLTGNCGPNAYQTLTAAGIGVIVGCSGTVRNVIGEFKADQYSTAQEPNVASHFGVGSTSTAPVGSAVGSQPESAFALGVGAGRGRGGGFGRGIGREGRSGSGMGQGSGRGMGQGSGRGMGRGMGRGRMALDPSPNLQPQPPSPPQPDAVQELDALKAQTQAVETQLAALKAEISRMEPVAAAPRLVAVVDHQRCLACGRCIQFCPSGAITLNTVAAIDSRKCTACGQCVAACPQEAIVLKAWRNQASSAGPEQADQ